MEPPRKPHPKLPRFVTAVGCDKGNEESMYYRVACQGFLKYRSGDVHSPHPT